MILISLRDLQFRRRRFAVGVLGTALVLGITLVLSGIPASFDNEARRTVESFRAEGWIVKDGVTGPFLSSASLPATLAQEITAATGVEAVPVALLGGLLSSPGSPKQISIHGFPPGSFPRPSLRDGRQPDATGEVVIDSLLGHDLGATIVVNGRPFEVVGRTRGLSYKAGLGTVSVTMADAQALAFGGADLATTIVVRDPIDAAPAGYAILGNDEVRADMLEPLKNPKQTILSMQWLLWVVATMIVGSVVYLSALDRLRDFAVFKAMGATDRTVVAGLIVQALLLCTVAYVVALAISEVLGPRLPMQCEIPASAYAGLAAVSFGVAILASVAGTRRAVSVDPALAFGGA